MRVVGTPELGDLPADDPLGTRAVFAHLLGSYRRISGFDAYGHAELRVRIRGGACAGLHWVWLEPALLRRRRRRGEGVRRGERPTAARLS